MNGANRRLADNRFGKFALGLEARERILEAKLASAYDLRPDYWHLGRPRCCRPLHPSSSLLCSVSGGGRRASVGP